MKNGRFWVPEYSQGVDIRTLICWIFNFFSIIHLQSEVLLFQWLTIGCSRYHECSKWTYIFVLTITEGSPEDVLRILDIYGQNELKFGLVLRLKYPIWRITNRKGITNPKSSFRSMIPKIPRTSSGYLFRDPDTSILPDLL